MITEYLKGGNTMTVNDYNTFFSLLSEDKFKEAFAYKNSKIPDTLYKYYSLTDDEPLNDSKLSYLEQGKIFLSPFTSFNDPFEGNYLIFDDKKLEQYGWDRKLIEEYYTRMISPWKVSCLSNTNEQNMPMWAYYANNHQGYCVKYCLSEKDKNLIIPVSYESKRTYANSIITHIVNEIARFKTKGYTISPQTNVYNFIMLLSMAAKHISWKHEKEYRIMSMESSYALSPRSIFIGINCKDVYKKKLINIGNNFPACPVFEMQIIRDEENFELQENQII